MYSYNPYYANYLMHYGTPKHSGRYPWGSGDRPYQHDGGSSKVKRKFARRTNKFLKQASKTKIRSDYKEGKYTKDEKHDLIKGIKQHYKDEKRDIKKNDLGMTKNEYYKNTTGEFRNTHSLSRLFIGGTWNLGIIPNAIFTAKSRQYNRLPDNIQKNVDNYINDAKKYTMSEVNSKLKNKVA